MVKFACKKIAASGPKPIRPAPRRPVTSLTLPEKLRPGFESGLIILYDRLSWKVFCQNIASPLDIPGRHEGIWPPGPCRIKAVQFPDAISHEKLTAKNLQAIRPLDFIRQPVFPIWAESRLKTVGRFTCMRIRCGRLKSNQSRDGSDGPLLHLSRAQ